MLVSLQQLAIEFGIMVSFWIDYGTVSFSLQDADILLTLDLELYWRYWGCTIRSGVARSIVPSASTSAHPYRWNGIHAV